MIFKNYFSFLFFLLIISQSLYANGLSKKHNCSITGQVIDSVKAEAIPFANVVLYNGNDSSLITGVVCNANGGFVFEDLSEGKYFIYAQSIGFAPRTVPEIKLEEGKDKLALGAVFLEASNTAIEEVMVTAKLSTIVFETDKKVLNVGSDITELGGTAVDAVKKLPSVQVDYAGAVTIRGNSDFKVLINGKPTTLSGQEELQKIPVMMIDKMELITNASAEYDTEGTAALINIITKKQKLTGFNGHAEGAYNVNGSGSTGVKLGYKFDKLSIVGGFNYNRSDWKYKNEFYQTSYDDNRDIIGNSVALGSFHNEGENFLYTLGLDWEPDSNNSFSISGTYIDQDRINNLENDYKDSDTLKTDYYKNKAFRSWNGPEYRVNAFYEHYFDTKNHKLSLNAYYYSFFQNHDNGSNNYITNDKKEIPYADSTDSYYNRINEVERTDLRLSARYDRPIGENQLLAVGYNYNLYNRTDDSETDTDFPPSDISEYDTIPHIYGEYKTQTQALFTTFSGSIEKFNYKLGARVEYYQRDARISPEEAPYNEDFFTFFPSVHLSYKLEREQQLALSYGTRTYRPLSWMIFKIPTYHNKNYAYIGNPKLEPTYTHNIEFSYNKSWESSNFYTELFYTKRIKSIQTFFVPDSNDVRIGFPENIDHHFTTGSSSMFTYNKIKWLTFRQGLDVFYTEIQGTSMNTSLSFSSSSRFQFTLSKIANLTANAYYTAPMATVQGTTKARILTELGLSRKFLKNRGTFAISMWDPFQLVSYDTQRTDANYNDRYYYYNDAINLNFYLSYTFNNYKNNKASGGNGNSTTPQFLTQ